MRRLCAEYKSPLSFLYQDSFLASSQLLSQDTQLLLKAQYCPGIELYKALRAQGGSSERWQDPARNKSKQKEPDRFTPHRHGFQMLSFKSTMKSNAFLLENATEWKH